MLLGLGGAEKVEECFRELSDPLGNDAVEDVVAVAAGADEAGVRKRCRWLRRRRRAWPSPSRLRGAQTERLTIGRIASSCWKHWSQVPASAPTAWSIMRFFRRRGMALERS